MTAAAVVTRGRRAAESLMVDSCTIAEPGTETFDPVTGNYTTTPGATLYAGKCRVRVGSALAVQEVEAGGAVLAVQRLDVQVPVSVTGVQVGDTVRITAAALDPALLDKRFRVTGVVAKTHATSRRLHAEEVAS